MRRFDPRSSRRRLCRPQPRETASSDVSPLLAGRIAGPAQTCVEADDVTMLRVLDRHAVGLERGGVLWVSRPAQDCPRLSPSDALAVEMPGREYCRGDRFRTIPPA
jgi:hypothetical protein